MPEHILTAYDEELGRLNKMIVEMGGLAESQLADAIEAVAKRDSDLAARVIRTTRRSTSSSATSTIWRSALLALRQPMARDLREIVAALKIAADIERICDLRRQCRQTLDRAGAIAAGAAGVRACQRMAHLAQLLVKDVIDAYVARDADKAIEVWNRDEELDEMYSSVFRELLTYMMEDPRNIRACTHLLFMAKNIERIGDHATNIAENLYYLVHGTPLTGARPKSDKSSLEMFAPEPAAGRPPGAP